MTNRYTKALKHLKSKELDEKLELLSEIPTNNIGNLYVNEPAYIVQDPDVPGEVTREANFDQDGDGAEGYTGNDTTGLFDDDGTILTIEPPGDTSYILGPMSSMWYAWGNFTQIGYIRESDRRMVNLGRITGQLQNWDGVSNFTSYGQLTLEQASWFKDTPKYLNGYDNYRAFYPGPPSNTPDEYGRYYCSITGTTKSTTSTPPPRRVPDVMDGPDPNLLPGSANPFRGTGMAMISAMDNDMATTLLAGIISGALWALQLLQQIGVNAWDAIQVLQSKTGEYSDLGPDTDNPYQKELQRKAREQSLPKEKSYERSDSPEKKAEREAADQKIRDAEQEIKDAESSGNKDRIDRAHDNYGKAVKNRQRVRAKQKTDRKAQERASGMPENVLLNKSILTENRKRIFRDLKKPVEIKEAPTKFKVKPKVRNNKSVGSDMMKTPVIPKEFKPHLDIWRKEDYPSNLRASQEKKNQVLELVGAAEHHWSYLIENKRKEKQEKINEMLASDFDKQMEIMYEKYKLKENKVDKLISSIKKNKTEYSGQPSPNGFPDTPPPKMVNGYHPEFGKRGNMYNTLDKISASSMPETGDPEIDGKVTKAKKQPK